MGWTRRGGKLPTASAATLRAAIWAAHERWKATGQPQVIELAAGNDRIVLSWEKVRALFDQHGLGRAE